MRWYCCDINSDVIFNNIKNENGRNKKKKAGKIVLMHMGNKVGLLEREG